MILICLWSFSQGSIACSYITVIDVHYFDQCDTHYAWLHVYSYNVDLFASAGGILYYIHTMQLFCAAGHDCNGIPFMKPVSQP